MCGRILNKMEDEMMHITPTCDTDNIKFNFVASESQVVHTSGEIVLFKNSIVEEVVDSQDSEVVVNDNTNNSSSTQDLLECTKSDCSEVSSTSNHLEQAAPSREIKVSARHPCTYPGCKEVFSRPWRLAAHMSKHTGHKPFACPIEGCNKKYGSSSHLKRHTDNVHCGQRRIITEYSCPEEKCTKVFRSTQSVKKHYKLCHSDKASESSLFKCQSCNDTFSSMEYLEKHNRVEKCPGGLKECPALENARERENEEYCCSESVCDNVSLDSLLLQKRMMSVHNSCSEVICYVCDKKFASKFYLKCHFQTHLPSHERKQFECPYEDCTRQYTTKYNLQQHISSNHEGKKFTCMYEECMGKKFSTKQKLRQHLKRHVLAPCSKVKETIARRKRRDTGLPKRSMAVKLSGVQVPYHIEKSVLNMDLVEENDEKEQSVLHLDSSDESDEDEWDDSMDGLIEAAFQHFKSCEEASKREKQMLQASEL